MKRRLVMLSVVIVTMLLISASSTLAVASPVTTIKVYPHPTNYPLELGVGESITFDVLIKSGEPFVVALAMSDA